MRTRRSWKNQERLWKAIGRDLGHVEPRKEKRTKLLRRAEARKMMFTLAEDDSKNQDTNNEPEGNRYDET